MNDETTEALVVHVERWRVDVMVGAAQAERFVRLRIDVAPMGWALMFGPAKAREVGRALIDHADNAESRTSSEQN